MSDISFHQRLDEAFKAPSLATIFNTRGVVPDPAVFTPDLPASGLEGLDDTDEFESRRGACKVKGEVRLRDAEGNDITDSLEHGYQGNMGIWVDHSPDWKAHHDYEEFPGVLSTRPPLQGPECVVWVDAPSANQPRSSRPYGTGVAYPQTTVDTAWYRPEGEWGPAMWIDKR
jgi:hypothetical protein